MCGVCVFMKTVNFLHYRILAFICTVLINRSLGNFEGLLYMLHIKITIMEKGRIY